MDARILHGSRNPVDLPGLSCQIHTQTITFSLKAFPQFLHNTVCVLNHHLGFGLCWEVKLNKKLLAGHGLEKGEGNEFTVEIVPVFPKPYSSFSKYMRHSSCKYSSISLSTLLRLIKLFSSSPSTTRPAGPSCPIYAHCPSSRPHAAGLE